MPSFVSDQELEERRSLLKAAAAGNVPAQLKLDEEYHVRVYSVSERKRYAKTTIEPNKSSPTSRRKLDRLIESLCGRN